VYSYQNPPVPQATLPPTCPRRKNDEVPGPAPPWMWQPVDMAGSEVEARDSYALRWTQLSRQSRTERDALIRMISVELFFAHGYEAVGIRQIAAGLGINSATLYHYYQSKGRILESIMASTHAAIIDSTLRAAEEELAPRLRFGAVAGSLAAAQVVSRKTCYVVDNEKRALDRESAAGMRILDYRRQYERIWDEVIAAGVREGVFDCSDQTVIRLALMGMFTSTSLWYHPNEDRDPEYVSLSLVDAGLSLLRAQPLDTDERARLLRVLRFSPFDSEPGGDHVPRGPLEFAELMVE
jgi:AcrR family transcriptional regulator